MFKHKELPYVPAGAIPGTSLGPQAREKIPRKRDNLPPSPPPPMVPLKVKNSKKGKEKSHEEQHAPFTPPHIRHFPAQSQEKRYVTLEDIQALKPNRKNPSPEKDHTREHGGSAWLSRTASHFKVPSEVHGKADANGKKKNLKDMISGPIGGAILEATTYEGNAPLRRTETHGRAPKGKQPETSMQRSTNRRPGPQQVEQFPDPKKRPTWKHFKEQYKDAKEATHFDQARVDKHDNYTPRGPYDRRGPSLSDQDLVKPKHRFAPPPIDTTLANDLVPRPLNVKSGMAQRRRSASEVTTRDTRRPSRRLKKRGHSVSYSASWDIVP
ncbi:hypothetical protein K491DRAFT_697321 [Lophiostoma macrostomum CBS 122681]|uniref:Pal1-domain-containing protein n=1 Tax=Lophiostoma macrostomum CBS 122681 TaxID=1314788 RepID=A0A6A6SRU6_9PLEO|nr:hypothetical protein K491DRAFT_697321 [Lophiostoma macrostomum CBS 122681]